jgi:hypothetical protein
MRIHSEMVGPWIPEEVVIGMSVRVKSGWETKWSTPAERRWIRLRLEMFCQVLMRSEVSLV